MVESQNIFKSRNNGSRKSPSDNHHSGAGSGGNHRIMPRPMGTDLMRDRILA